MRLREAITCPYPVQSEHFPHHLFCALRHQGALFLCARLQKVALQEQALLELSFSLKIYPKILRL